MIDVLKQNIDAFPPYIHTGKSLGVLPKGASNGTPFLLKIVFPPLR